MSIGFWWKKLNARDRLEDICRRRITYICILKKFEGVDWIQLAQNRDRWRALVNVDIRYRKLFFNTS
jgi:hypothetical protein